MDDTMTTQPQWRLDHEVRELESTSEAMPHSWAMNPQP